MPVFERCRSGRGATVGTTHGRSHLEPGPGGALARKEGADVLVLEVIAGSGVSH